MRIRHIKGSEEAVSQNPFVVQDPAAYRNRWCRDIFGNDQPLRLEIGMGMGRFIREQSFKNPDINYIGLELNTTVLYKSMRRYEADLRERGLEAEESSGKNLRFIRSDARFLTEYFGEGEIDRIYLNFSDPWPKDKNANKRLTSPIFLRLYERVLDREGLIEFKTDNRGLFDYSVGSFGANGWNIAGITYDLHNDLDMNSGNVMTEYEAKFSQKGNRIYKLIAARPSESIGKNRQD